MPTTPTLHSSQRAQGRFARGLILVNPRSFRMSLRGRLERVTRLAKDRGIPIVLASKPAEMASSIDEALEAGTELITLLGGDGTLQAAVSILAHRRQQVEDELPRLLMLGGGRTNYTARDLGTHRSLVDTLSLAIDAPEHLKETRRHSLCIEQDDYREYGFFIAAALVDHVIRDCHHYRATGKGFLRTGHPSSAWRVMQLAVKGLLGRSDFQPPVLTVDAGPLGRLHRPARLMLLTSLHHRNEWVDPYADRGQGEIRVSVISSDAQRFWLRVPAMVSGRYSADMLPEQGYLSGRAEQVVVRGLGQICLDGQEHDFDPAGELTISTGPALRFVHR